MAAVGADIVALELAAEILSALWHLRGVAISLDKEYERGQDSHRIEGDIPHTLATCHNTEGNGYHRNEASGGAECVELALGYLQGHILVFVVVPDGLQPSNIGWQHCINGPPVNGKAVCTQFNTTVPDNRLGLDSLTIDESVVVDVKIA